MLHLTMPGPSGRSSPPIDRLPRSPMPILLVLAACAFISGLSLRLIDPLVVDIARDLDTTPEAVALLVSAFLFPYALSQPFIGALGDAYGKVRVIKACLGVLASMLAVMAMAPSIEVLYAVRILGGAFGGGVFTIALAIVGDRIAFAGRQVALSNLIMAVILSQLAGMIGSGIIASYFGWRAPVAIAAGLAVVVFLLASTSLRPKAGAERQAFSASRLVHSFREILRSPRAATCFTGVFLDGMAVLGLLPFVAILLEARGAGGLKEAGFVLGGLGLGGLTYVLSVRHLLELVGGMLNLLRVGGLVTASGLLGFSFGGPWQLEMAEFVLVGFGFYMVHASLQAQATEISVEHRATSVSLHSFFFCLGQAVGPVVYAAGMAALGPTTTIQLAAFVMLAIGFMTAARFERLAATEQG